MVAYGLHLRKRPLSSDALCHAARSLVFPLHSRHRQLVLWCRIAGSC